MTDAPKPPQSTTLEFGPVSLDVRVNGGAYIHYLVYRKSGEDARRVLVASGSEESWQACLDKGRRAARLLGGSV